MKLEEVAKERASQVKTKTEKGGRRTLGDRLFGSPDLGLAEDCKEFAESHGCMSQAVQLRMVQAVYEAAHGKDEMRKKDGKPSQNKGRKSVQKLAQTKKKIITV